MNNAPRFDQAVSPTSHVVVCVRSFAACCLLGGAVSCAFAGPGDGPRDAPQGRDGRSQQMSQQDGRGDARYDQRQIDQRDQRQIDPRAYDTRADDQRRAAAQEQNRAESARRNGRMTADERRDLRRQINEAGQDLYNNPPRR